MRLGRNLKNRSPASPAAFSREQLLEIVLDAAERHDDVARAATGCGAGDGRACRDGGRGCREPPAPGVPSCPPARGGDVRLVGGPRTIEAFRALGALDKLGLLVVPLLVGDGMRLTPTFSTEAELVLESERSLPGGSVEIVYACN